MIVRYGPLAVLLGLLLAGAVTGDIGWSIAGVVFAVVVGTAMIVAGVRMRRRRT